MSFLTPQMERLLFENKLSQSAMRAALTQMLDLPTGPLQVTVTRGLRVPMRDGIALIADHWIPVGVEVGPAVLVRTPYGRGGPSRAMWELAAQKFASHGYHVIAQDVRGRFDSEGEFTAFVNETDDGVDSLEWMAMQPWCDGKIGMWGPSYLGYVQWAAAAGGSPYLKALVPIIAHSHLMQYHDNGFPLDLLVRWMFQLTSMDDGDLGPIERMRRVTDAAVQDRHLADAFTHLPLQTADERAIGKVDPLYREMSESGPDDPAWQAVDHSAAVAKAPPALFVSGWYDLFLDGLLEDYATQAQAGLAPRLSIGPWAHMETGYIPVAFREGLRWYTEHLRGEPASPDEKPVHLYVMGANRWRQFEQWPPPSQPLRLYLHGNGAAKTGRLFAQSAPAGMTPDSYTYNPADPTPNYGGPKLASDAGPVDNRPLERRPDVLVFSSIPLREDVTFAGPVQLELYVKSNRPTTDFFGRLCVVDKTGRSTNICDGNFRVEPGRGETQPDGSLRISVSLSATAYRVRAGQRLRVLVASGAHPRFARNLGILENQATAVDMLPAEQTVYHDAAHPSALVLPLLDAQMS